jgi:hypothetical protein
MEAPCPHEEKTRRARRRVTDRQRQAVETGSGVSRKEHVGESRLRETLVHERSAVATRAVCRTWSIEWMVHVRLAKTKLAKETSRQRQSRAPERSGLCQRSLCRGR